MLQFKPISLFVGLSLALIACGASPGEEEVKRSIYTVMRGYESSTKNVDPLVTKEYGNGAELKFVSRDRTLVNEMKILIQDDKSLTASGRCLLSGYEDPYSGFGVEGELTYDCERSGQNYATCDFACQASLTGGKIKELGFELTLDSDGNISVASVTADGKEVSFSQWAFVTQIIRAFSAASFSNAPGLKDRN